MIKIMDTYYEKQTEVLSCLNDFLVEPTPELEMLMEIMKIKYIDIENGWYIPEDD